MILQVSCPCLDHLQSVPKLQHRKQKAMVAQRVRVAQLGGNDAHVDETYCRCSEYRLTLTWMFPKIGGKPPKWMVKIMENPIKMDDLGAHPYFWKHPYGYRFASFQTDITISPSSESSTIETRVRNLPSTSMLGSLVKHQP